MFLFDTVHQSLNQSNERLVSKTVCYSSEFQKTSTSHNILEESGKNYRNCCLVGTRREGTPPVAWWGWSYPNRGPHPVDIDDRSTEVWTRRAACRGDASVVRPERKFSSGNRLRSSRLLFPFTSFPACAQNPLINHPAKCLSAIFSDFCDNDQQVSRGDGGKLRRSAAGRRSRDPPPVRSASSDRY